MTVASDHFLGGWSEVYAAWGECKILLLVCRHPGSGVKK